jgi:hypothetical protein
MGRLLPTSTPIMTPLSLLMLSPKAAVLLRDFWTTTTTT